MITGERVLVFKVVGAPVQRAVYVEPYGAMTRSHFGRSETSTSPHRR
jgi:hypothetical protein